MAALLFSLACSPCAPPSGPAAPSPVPDDVLPLSALSGPCDDFRRSRELAVEHTRKGMAADDPYLFAQTGTCDGFQRILFFQGERGPVRELYFSGGALVAGRETGKGASRWFGRLVQTTRPIEDDPGHEESLCRDAQGLRQEASATLSHRRGVLVFHGARSAGAACRRGPARRSGPRRARAGCAPCTCSRSRREAPGA